MAELTTADEMEFESWPEHMQQLAWMYVKESKKHWLRPVDGWPNEQPRMLGKSWSDQIFEAYEAGFEACEASR